MTSHAGAEAGADELIYEAEAALREYCRQANTNLIIQPVSLLQRRLKTGYSRTLSIVQQLEERGVLSPLIGSSTSSKD